MTNSPAFYSVIQYCPDFGKAEGANIGVVLFCPEPHQILFQMDSDNWRAKQFFGATSFDEVRLDAAKASLANHLTIAAEKLRNVGDFTAFIGSLANQLQLTTPRYTLVTNAEDDIDQLFLDLVGDPPARKKRLSRKIRSVESMCDVLLSRHVPIVRNPPSLKVKFLPKPVKAPFVWLNGKMNYLKTVGVHADPDDAAREAAELGSQGQLLEKYASEKIQRHLVVVAHYDDNPSAEARASFEGIILEHGVSLFNVDQLPELERKITREAKEIAPSLLEEEAT